ncbi:helicase-exonuclease AddAB subunit AddA [Companilactobacillus halodurans]|uniref:ATP-dependent helicase/nuclease subunit A n=1 Tax=Companilactobacillus halodurans TaxID=2584183 RepID=A0A5P0ZVP9_9LACO|nr:helicase-exonuclease AddAB subunit AddA [Companilactobacillus halodurans]MQS76402.1 helicase-exonuclease AddAB subunit AddA [Companilactobacillus halodurans]MQS96804.1 helicase-exonuclease AddAB subunit AddA [Companilactobacillus halodurans]
MPEWTEDQKKAIYHRGHDILVSAAAGSGKTTILIKRIIEMLKNDGEDIDNLLVATFTEAAAQEMKDRLLSSLKDELNSETDAKMRQHLQKQIFHIPMSNISTLHAFCLSVIKKFYYVIELDPNFRLLSDDTEKSIIQEQAYDNVRDSYYSSGDIDFLRLTDNFTNDRSDDGLKDIIFKLYDFAITNADTNEWLENLITAYQFKTTFSESQFYQTDFLPQVKARLEQIREEVLRGIELANEDELANSYLKVFQEINEWLLSLEEQSPTKNYDEIRTLLANFKPKAKKDTIKKADKEGKDLSFLNDASKIRADITKQVTSLYDEYFVKAETDVNDSLRIAQGLIEKLVEVEHSFIKEFDRLKQNNHVLDFNDLEHKAVAILTGEVDGHKIALEYYQNKFHELMIDEYQDVNAMQEKIISLLSCENNHRFMVGDIKQSIYGFRQAAPYIFTDKYAKYQKDDNPNELIQLSKNFRSSVAVDDFVNQIFTRIFDQKIGDIDYDESSKLVVGTNFPKSVDMTNEFNVLIKNEDDETAKRQLLITQAAKRIQKLMNNNFQIYDSKIKADTDEEKVRPLKYSDIAILSRTKENNTDLISYFSKANIPIMVTDAQNYFQTTELQIMMSMLDIIDNPYQDIPLVAVLRSPIVGMDEEMLSKIRLVDKRETYFTAMNEYLNFENADQHIKNSLESFLMQLNNYRDFANKNSIARLIWKIYQETGLLEYVSGVPGGKQRAANLHALYQRANSYEENNYKGLHQFIGFIDRMQKLDKDLSQPNSIEATEDTVKVMTVHASKGLEFPVVIYLDMAKQFNMQDVNANTVFDAHKGIGITLSDNDSRLQYRTMQRGIISNQKKISTVSEEMRLLYVALTRAKQKLIMFGFTKSPDDLLKTWDDIHPNGHLINESARLKANSFQNLVGISTLSGDDRNEVDENHFEDSTCQLDFHLISTEKAVDNQAKIIIPKKAPVEPSSLFKQSVDDILNMDYQHQEAVNTTAYQSVSEIKGLFADPDDEQMSTNLFNQDKKNNDARYNLGSFAKPSFLTKTKQVTAADIGSATHLVLQKIDIEKEPQINDFESLIAQMVNEKQLTKELADKIDCESLVKFYQSDLGKLIVENHENVSREYTCSILMSAQKLFKNSSNNDSTNDKILVHGIIDGVIELDQGIVIFDYKTDNVTSQNLHELISKYSGQVNLYAEAISAIKTKPVVGKYLYFLKINQAVNLEETKR